MTEPMTVGDRWAWYLTGITDAHLALLVEHPPRPFWARAIVDREIGRRKREAERAAQMEQERKEAAARAKAAAKLDRQRERAEAGHGTESTGDPIVCTICEEVKPEQDMSRTAMGLLHGWCRGCSAEQHRIRNEGKE